MLKELKINKTYTISNENLYKYYKNKRKSKIDNNYVITFFGFEIHHTTNGVCEGSTILFSDYYDLTSSKTGEILCMDGETVRVLNHELDCYTLISEESDTPFQLSQDEVNRYIF